jgi:S1-C subfamily serine protease
VLLFTAASAAAQTEPLPPLPAPQSRPPSPQPQATAAEPARAIAPSGACDTGWVSRIYRQAKPSIARVERPDGGGGTGFVFRDARHVATAFHVVDLGRSLTVQFPEGGTFQAEVVAVDEGMDLAILELDADAPAPPLEPHEDIEIGTPVMAIGNPYGNLTRSVSELEGLLNFSVTQGTVSALSSRYVQTDALLSPGNSGGPILTCDGRVVAVVDFGIQARIGVGVAVSHLVKLSKQIGRQGVYRGKIGLKDFQFGLMTDIDANPWFGPSLGFSVVFYDRFATTLRGAVLWGSHSPTNEPIVDRSSTRITLDLLASYRFLLFPYSLTPTYFILGAGGSIKWDRRDVTSFRVSYDNPACPGLPSGCDPKLASDLTTNKVRLLSPVFTAAIRFATLQVGYAWLPDPRDFGDTSTHRLTFDFVF